MVLGVVEKVASASCCCWSVAPSPFRSRRALSNHHQQQQLFLSVARTEVDCCSASGWKSRRDRAMAVASMVPGEFSSSSFSSPSEPDVCRGFTRRLGVIRFRSRGRETRGNRIVTRALPVDGYWITAFQAIAVSGLMAGIAVVTGIFINMRIEVQALAEYLELEEKGLLPDEMIIPDKDFEDFDLESPLYIFNAKQLSSTGPSRNRPVREELQSELEPELEIASKE